MLPQEILDNPKNLCKSHCLIKQFKVHYNMNSFSYSVLDVTVRFEPEVYRVSESSGSVVVRLVLLGETSNTVAVTLRTSNNKAIGIHISYIHFKHTKVSLVHY